MVNRMQSPKRGEPTDIWLHAKYGGHFSALGAVMPTKWPTRELSMPHRIPGQINGPPQKSMDMPTTNYSYIVIFIDCVYVTL